MRWRIATFLITVAALVAAAVSSAGCDTPEPGPRLMGQVRMTFLHTSDIHSRLFPYDLQIGHIDSGLGLGEIGNISNVGGAARISHVIGRERARASRVLHLDGGDCFQGAPVFNFFSGEAEIRSLSAMGADGMIVANHEFDHGALNLSIQLQNWANFPVMVANYKLEDPSLPGNSQLGSVVQPFTTYDLDGLRVGVIGMGNLSSLSSIYDQPNRLGVLPLKTSDVAQFYIDLLRPLVDLVVFVTHLGLDFDQRMIEQTEGIDIVLGGHNHIVLQPPKRVRDCGKIDRACAERCANDPRGRSAELCTNEDCHFVELVSPDAADPDVVCEPDDLECSDRYGKVRRFCRPRDVVLTHSGAFAKYVGRLDVVASNKVEDLPVGFPYSPHNGHEVVSHSYRLFAINASVPEDPIVKRVLEPFERELDVLTDLELLVGYAPGGSRRFSSTGGDSQLGNMIATAMWLRLGVQTDFSLTNTTGIRADLVPGPINVEQMFNVFPFDNSVSKMQLSGKELQELMDFVARRSSGRGCTSQIQIAGSRVVLDCTQDDPNDDQPAGKATYIYVGVKPCADDGQCPGGLCNLDVGACACSDDSGCSPPGAEQLVSSCDQAGLCWQPIDPIASYELATSNYLANGGSGFRVLQRNTTQFDTKIQQRDALVDFIRGGRPCGSARDGSLSGCQTDDDCTNLLGDGFVCACPEMAVEGELCGTKPTGACPLASGEPGPGDGACVLAACRTDVAAYERTTCDRAPNEESRLGCLDALAPCATAGEQCKFLSCIDDTIGNAQDGRVKMVGR
jgi:5'-nucleotidase/UDP-sugar diphosphatase